MKISTSPSTSASHSIPGSRLPEGTKASCTAVTIPGAAADEMAQGAGRLRAASRRTYLQNIHDDSGIKLSNPSCMAQALDSLERAWKPSGKKISSDPWVANTPRDILFDKINDRKGLNHRFTIKPDPPGACGPDRPGPASHRGWPGIPPPPPAVPCRRSWGCPAGPPGP